MESAITFMRIISQIETNTGIVNFLTNNAILISMIITFGVAISKMTKGTKDDSFWAAVKKTLRIGKPNLLNNGKDKG